MYSCICGAPTIKRPPEDLEGHPFRGIFEDEEFRYCNACDSFSHPCSGCDDVTVDWWSKDFQEIWDDLYVCETCKGIFCPGCNQNRGKFVGDYPDYMCESCVRINEKITGKTG